MKRAHVRSIAVAIAAMSCGCATASAPARGPEIAIVESAAGARGATCGVQPELARGAVPPDARVIVQIEMTSTRPESLRAFEDLALLKALEKCATNVSLLRAVDADGHGILAVTAALWERSPPPP